jgi:hypothetical protein
MREVQHGSCDILPLLEGQPMKVHRDKSISNESFVLEEHVFINCTLKNCDLFYSGGDHEVVDLKLDVTRFHFRGEADKTIRLLRALGLLKEAPPQTMSISSQKPN